MTAPHTRARRLGAIVLAVTILAALLPAGASAAAPALQPLAEPEHGYGVIREPGGPEGIVLLEERPAGLFVGIGMTDVRVRVVTLLGATAPCGMVGFSTVRLGTFHPVDGRFAAGYVTSAADAVDAIASVRLMAGTTLLACRTLVHGDRDGVSCDTDPNQPDCPRLEHVAPEVADFAKLLRLGLIVFLSERPGSAPASAGPVVAQLLVLRPFVGRIVFGDAPCADGGGQKLGAIYVPADDTVGVSVMPVTGLVTVVDVASVWVRGGPTTCIDGRPLQRVARNG